MWEHTTSTWPCWLILINTDPGVVQFLRCVVSIFSLKLISNLERDTSGLSKYPVPHQTIPPRFSNLCYFLPKLVFTMMVAKWQSFQSIPPSTLLNLHFTIRKSFPSLSPTYFAIYYQHELRDSYFIHWAKILYSPDLFFVQKWSQTWSVGSPSN